MSEHTGRWVVYILRCSDRSLYTGVTNDLAARVRAHGDGVASKYTRSRRPVRIVYSEPTADRSSAQTREAQIKRLSRAEKEAMIRSARAPS